jgi:hypothetical protein
VEKLKKIAGEKTGPPSVGWKWWTTSQGVTEQSGISFWICRLLSS